MMRPALQMALFVSAALLCQVLVATAGHAQEVSGGQGVAPPSTEGICELVVAGLVALPDSLDTVALDSPDARELRDSLSDLRAALDDGTRLKEGCFLTEFGPSRWPGVLCADGPHGSGRHWSVSLVYRSDAGERGLIVEPRTVFWRHLANPEMKHTLAPLPWLTDADGDGGSELVIWDSLPFSEFPSESSYSAAVQVFRLEDTHFVIDLDATTEMARQVAASYEEVADTGIGSAPNETYRSIAAALRGKCREADAERSLHDR